MTISKAGLGGIPSVCFVAHCAYRALAQVSTGHIGGVEHQQALMAKCLAGRGYRVTVLTWDEGQAGDLVAGGVRVIKMCRKSAGVKGLRFFHPKWTSLVKAMREADADVYYQNCAECVTGQVALWCRMNGRTFVYSVANDPDVDPALPEMRTLRERVLYRYGLRKADHIIVQTEVQQAMLHDGFHLESEVIPMPCAGPSDAEYRPPVLPPPSGARILWIGRVCEQKRPEWLIDLAAACPEFHFDLVGPVADTEHARQAVRRASEAPNVTVHGPVPFEKVAQCYREAACLVSTSAYEGFPNTFIEAWSHGLPVISTFDPDHLIARRELGVAAADVPGLAAGLRPVLGSSDTFRRMSANARRYYCETHTVDAVMPRFERVFLDVARSVGRSRCQVPR